MSGEGGNAAGWFVDRHVAEGRGEKTAFIEGDRSISYGGLAAGSARVAGFLAERRIPRESRAAMIVLDTLEFPTLFWGCLRGGVVPVCLNTLLTTEQYRQILADCRPRLLFVSAALWPVVGPALGADGPEVFVLGGEAGGHPRLEPLVEAAPPAPMAEVSADEVAFWLYSSGSTGSPKGVMHVHGSLKGTCDTYASQVLGIREEDVCYSAAKLFFAYGLGNGMSFPMSVGATVALLPTRPTPDAVFALMERVEPTIFFGVPTLYAAMLAGRDELPGTRKLRMGVSAGEALPAEVGERWKRLTGTDILDGVGSTEMLHIFLSNAPGDVEYGTSGRPVPGYRARLVDEHGAEVAPGEVGELLIAGETAANGYWNQRGRSRATFEGVWTRTGDKYIRRADGRYVYCGRTDDMFKVSGQWVAPFEVESALISHDAVLEAAVVPAEDDDGLTKPLAFVVLKSGASADEAALQAHVKSRIERWKYPRWIRFETELPKTATGKIQRFKLRQRETA